jgi:dTDP-4-dehydro-6-deoxy-alpha-D-glucopyranose 2,3-dehydratase
MTLMTPPPAPLGIGAPDVARRFTRSAAMADSPVNPSAAFEAWFAGRRARAVFDVRQIEFGNLRGWSFDPETGDLGHDSGRFFRIEGLDVRTDWGWQPRWSQPIINQPEIGILGIVVKEFDGVLHVLLQAKTEPGNIDAVQLSPTVQATRSNYTGAHGGRAIPYLEYFREPGRSRVLVDSLQSEQASWFLHKRNRNLVVEVTEDVELLDGFCWLTVGQLHRLLHREHVVNMDTRTVLSCIPFQAPNGPFRTSTPVGYREALVRSMAPVDATGSAPGALHTDGEVISWLTDTKTRHELVQRTVPLKGLPHWRRTETEIAHETGHYFRIIAVDVRAGDREVASWSQPLLAPVETGRCALLVRPVGGVLHLLLQARTGPGVLDMAELGPTVQCLPGSTADQPAHRQPRFLDVVAAARPDQIRYDRVQSEEGGRFHAAANRYQVIEVGEDFGLEVPPEFRWVTVGQVTGLLRHSHYLNVELRSLLATLHTTW